MRRSYIIILSIIIIVLVTISVWISPALEIINDFNDIRNTPPVVNEELMQHYRDSDIIDSLVSIGQHESAIIFINEILRNNARSSRKSYYIVRKGEVLYDQEKYTEAKNAFTEAILESDSFNLRAFVWRGYSYALLGDCDSANIDLLFAVSKNSSLKREYDRVKEFCY